MGADPSFCTRTCVEYIISDLEKRLNTEVTKHANDTKLIRLVQNEGLLKIAK